MRNIRSASRVAKHKERSLRLQLTAGEASDLETFLKEAIGAVCLDDRPDHGMAKLKINWKYEPHRDAICRTYSRLKRWNRKPLAQWAKTGQLVK